MSYEITIRVERVADEHAAYLTRLAATLAPLFRLDGVGREVDISVERDRDGVERVYEFLQFDEDWRPREEDG